MLERTIKACSLTVLLLAAGCGGENATLYIPPDASADSGASSEAGSDAASTDSGAPTTDSDTAEGGALSDAGPEGSAPAEAGVGPGGDGGLVLGGDGGGADASFGLQNPASTNLLSSSALYTSCATVAGSAADSFVMTCKESNGGAGHPCRTVTVLFAGIPTSGRVYTTVPSKATPAAGEAVVGYQESIDCTPATTNGWAEIESGGTFTVDVYGDTGIRFTLQGVPESPAPEGSWVGNHNAQGAFVLGGSGFSSFPYQ
jgi:hypothetical protein